MSRERPATVVLLSNASATGSGVGVQGGNYMLEVVAGTGGATIGLQVLGPDGVTWLPVGTAGAVSVAQQFYLCDGTYRGVVTGGTTPAAIYVSLVGIL